jgi:hypothetical protein
MEADVVRGGPKVSAWLKPLFDAARERGIDFGALIDQSAIPAAEADIPALDFFLTKPGEFVTGRVTDWVQVGYLLRDRLGWENTYPDFPGDDGTYPDFPEVPDIP